MNATVSHGSRRRLLAVIELGGYPDFTPLYKQTGFEVTQVVSVRRALVLLKQSIPDVVVAEFNFQSDFRDRTSSLESLLAMVERQPGRPASSCSARRGTPSSLCACRRATRSFVLSPIPSRRRCSSRRCAMPRREACSAVEFFWLGVSITR